MVSYGTGGLVYRFGYETGGGWVDGGVGGGWTGGEFSVGLLWCFGGFLSFSFGGLSFLFGYFGTEYA